MVDVQHSHPVVSDLLDAGTSRRVLREHAADQINRSRGVLLDLLQRRLGGGDANHERRERGGLEGQLQGQQLVENHPQRPDVALPAVGLVLTDLGGEVVGSPDLSLRLLG